MCPIEGLGPFFLLLGLFETSQELAGCTCHVINYGVCSYATVLERSAAVVGLDSPLLGANDTWSLRSVAVLSRAFSSSPKTSIMLDSIHSSVTHLPIINLSSEGSFSIRTNGSRLLKESEVTPNEADPRTLLSILSYNLYIYI